MLTLSQKIRNIVVFTTYVPVFFGLEGIIEILYLFIKLGSPFSLPIKFMNLLNMTNGVQIHKFYK